MCIRDSCITVAYCNKRLILASGSPRRRELLDKFGINYEILPAQGEESAPPELTPGERVKALAAQKAEEVAQRLNDPAAVILAADTLVELDGEVLGKPGTAERAQAMLRALSGREHRVWSGVCIREGEKVLAESECTSVHFRALTDAEIHAYITTGEPLDKAGAYGYQGLASLFVERIEGDFFNVMGLPVCRMGQMPVSYTHLGPFRGRA